MPGRDAPQDKNSDEALMRRAGRGDGAAFSLLVTAHARRTAGMAAAALLGSVLGVSGLAPPGAPLDRDDLAAVEQAMMDAMIDLPAETRRAMLAAVSSQGEIRR